MMSPVFISYSSDAKQWAEKLSESLENRGVSTWTDIKIKAGSRFSEEIEDAMEHAKRFVIVVGPKGLFDEWQDRECQAALKRTWTDPKTRIVPVLIGNAALPPFLETWQPILMKQGEDESSVIERIYHAIQEHGSEKEKHTFQENSEPHKTWRARLEAIENAALTLKESVKNSLQD